MSVFGAVARPAILAAARSPRLGRIAAGAPVANHVVRRFVAGEQPADAVAAARALTDDGLLVSIDHLGEDVLEAEQADAIATAYVTLLRLLDDAGLAPHAEVSVKLTALGQAFDEARATANAARVCEAATAVGTTVTVDMEDHTTTDSTLGILRTLRGDFPRTGAVVQAYLRRTEADCRDLAAPGSRVRLCKGAYKEPASVAFHRREEIDASYRRCLGALLAGGAYPMVASHDPELIAYAEQAARGASYAAGAWEYQMLYGVRPDEQRRLAKAGYQCRVYVPYGEAWYGYLMRRLAERPANLAFFLRAMRSRG